MKLLTFRVGFLFVVVVVVFVVVVVEMNLSFCGKITLHTLRSLLSLVFFGFHITPLLPSFCLGCSLYHSFDTERAILEERMDHLIFNSDKRKS